MLAQGTQKVTEPRRDDVLVPIAVAMLGIWRRHKGEPVQREHKMMRGNQRSPGQAFRAPTLE